MGDKTGSIDFFAGFLVGVLVGAATALLLAPQSGEDTRILIRDRGVELKGKAEDLQGQAKGKAADLQGHAKERAAELQAKMKEAVEEGKAAASKTKADLLSQLEGQPPVAEAED
jgi:gas vesicle protein